MVKKKNVTEDAFHAFESEIERNSRYLVEQLLQKINQLEYENNKKIEEKCRKIEKQYKNEIEKLNENVYRELQNLEQQNNDNIQNLTDCLLIKNQIQIL